MNNEKEEELLLNIPDAKSIPCLTCKKGMHNFLAMYCLAYKVKPSKVYYENVECEHYEPIK